MKLTQREIERLISEITTGRKLVVLENEKYYLRFPTRAEKLEAEHEYSKKLAELRKNAIPTEQEILELAHSQSIYTLQDERRYHQLESNYLHLLEKSRISAPEFRPAYDKKLKEIKMQLSLLEEKRNYIFSRSANYISEQHKLDYLLCKCIENENHEPIWSDVNIMLDTIPLDIYHALLNEFVNFLSGLPIEKIRAVARSSLWQAMYQIACDSGQKLFNLPISEWDINKILLVHWSAVYKNAFQNFGEVPPNILENDALFDEWLRKQTKKKK